MLMQVTNTEPVFSNWQKMLIVICPGVQYVLQYCAVTVYYAVNGGSSAWLSSCWLYHKLIYCISVFAVEYYGFYILFSMESCYHI